MDYSALHTMGIVKCVLALFHSSGESLVFGLHRCHPSAGPTYSVATAPTLATQPITVEYMGHSYVHLRIYASLKRIQRLSDTLYSAHAAASPWEGQNALDAAVLAYNNVALLRQQIRPDCRVHAIIEGRNWVPNSEWTFLHTPSFSFL